MDGFGRGIARILEMGGGGGGKNVKGARKARAKMLEPEVTPTN